MSKIGQKDKLSVALDILEIENNLFVPSEEGALLVIPNGSGTTRAILLPKRTRFTGKEDYELYSNIYDCEKPGPGEVRILCPAVVDKLPGGWLTVERGRLEIVAAEPQKDEASSPLLFPEARSARPLEPAVTPESRSPIITRPTASPVQPRMPTRKIAARCPNCKKLAEEDAIFCAYCGASVGEDLAPLRLTSTQVPAPETLRQKEAYRRTLSDTGNSDQAASNGAAIRTSQVRPVSQEAKGARKAPTLTMLENYGEAVSVPQRKWLLAIIVIAFLLTVVALALGWYSWFGRNPVAEQPPATTSTDQTVSFPTPDRTADEEFKHLRQRRIRTQPSENRQTLAAFEAVEKKYPHDYRFPYERAKLCVKGIISDQEAFSVLFLAAERALADSKGQKMLDDLMADKDGDFYKLSRGHNEWEVLVRALTIKDTALLKR